MPEGSFIGMDDFYVGAANAAPPASTPEPATWALLCGGIPLLFALKRARS